MPYRYLHGNVERGQRSLYIPHAKKQNQEQCTKERANVAEASGF